MEDQPTDRAESPSLGDEARRQLAQAYDACGADLYRHALMILADPAGAQDAVQQAFANLAAMGNRVVALSSRDGYLRTAVRNECYQALRRRQMDALSHEPQIPLESAGQSMADQEEREALEQALGQLPPEQREVVYLKVYQKLTFEQIGRHMGIPPNTAASRYRYALEHLRELMAQPTALRRKQT